MIVLVCGSRDFDTFKHQRWVDETLDEIHDHGGIELIHSGMANGPDLWGVWWARKNHIPWVGHKPIWKRNGEFVRHAGMERNQVMVEHMRNAIEDGYLAKIVAFWDGKSSGTANTIELARRLDVPIEVLQ